MLHCPLSFNHVFHRNLFPRSQRGELREKRCGLLPNRANFISFSGAPARRNGWTDFLRRKKLGIAEKGRREERGKMARDTGGIIVTSKTRDTPLLPPPQFSSKRTRRKVSSLVSVAHAVESVVDPAKEKNSLNFIHNGRSAANFQHPRTRPSSSRGFVRFRSRIFIPEVPTRGTRLVGTPVSVQGNSVHIRGDEWYREVEPVTRGGGGRRSRGVGLPRFSGTASADFQVGRALPYHCR